MGQELLNCSCDTTQIGVKNTLSLTRTIIRAPKVNGMGFRRHLLRPRPVQTALRSPFTPHHTTVLTPPTALCTMALQGYFSSSQVLLIKVWVNYKFTPGTCQELYATKSFVYLKRNFVKIYKTQAAYRMEYTACNRLIFSRRRG